MYQPQQHQEKRLDVLHQLIQQHPLATIVTQSQGNLEANHIPLYLSRTASPNGSLWGHMSRHNPLSHIQSPDDACLAIFQGPEMYITPSWYATKQQHGKVAPTWNYVVVHAHGKLRIIDDEIFLRTQLEALTTHNEANLEKPWAVDDAPEEFVKTLMKKIVPFEIDINKLEGKWKVSQNQPEVNRKSVLENLSSSSHPNAPNMLDIIKSTPSKNTL